MIESIQFSEGVLRLRVTDRVSDGPFEGYSCIQFYLSQGSTIAELHRSQLVNLVETVNLECARQISDLILKLLSAHPGVRGIYLDLFYGSRKDLEGSTATDEEVKLARGTV